MNNAWTSIACRTTANAARHTRTKPLLQLFNGYARCHLSVKRPTWPSNGAGPLQQPLKPASPDFHGCSFSTSCFLAARPKRSPTSRSTIKRTPSASKLEPAPTVASHTEGLPTGNEDLTWRDYDPAGGMPLPGGELSQGEINGVFGSEVLDADTGNYVLSVIYWRRLSGALIDVGLDFPKGSGIKPEQAAQALRYVRALAPDFDEQEAGRVWAEEESQRLQEQLQERAIKIGIYKRDEQPVEEEEEEEQQGTDYGRERNRESQLQQMKADNEARTLAKEAAKVDAEAKAEVAAMHKHRGPLELAGGVQPSVELVTYTDRAGISISRPKTDAWLQPVVRKDWVKYYEERAEIIKENAIPQLSFLQRLGPSFVFLVAILGFAFYVSENYTPPPQSSRIFASTAPAVSTLGTITGVLAFFFVLSRMPPLWRTSSKYFCIVPAYPYTFSLMGAVFRHDTLRHLASNVASLWLFGLLLYDDVGRGTFLSIFFAAGAFGGFTSLTYNVLRKKWMVYVFGASNAVLGVVAAACTLRPNGTIRVFGQDVPIAAWVFLALWGSGSVVAAIRMKSSSIDHAGHFGGLLAGAIAGILLRAKAKREKEESRVEMVTNVDANEDES